jgi:hypothetical protein
MITPQIRHATNAVVVRLGVFPIYAVIVGAYDYAPNLPRRKCGCRAFGGGWGCFFLYFAICLYLLT